MGERENAHRLTLPRPVRSAVTRVVVFDQPVWIDAAEVLVRERVRLVVFDALLFEATLGPAHVLELGLALDGRRALAPHQPIPEVAQHVSSLTLLYSSAMAELDPAGLLAAFDEQLRGTLSDRLVEGEQVERIGPLLCLFGAAGGGFVDYRDLAGLEGAELDELIARCVAFFAAHGEKFEWKLFGHDRPADLAQRLVAAGFVPEERETVVIAPVASIATEPELPPGVALREVIERTDLDRIAAFEASVWEDDRGWLADMLEGERNVDPHSLTIVVAEADGAIVCTGWVRFARGTEFASFWGGSTLPAWRRRGIYRATVAYRAKLAAERGVRFLQVDASDDSRPILERLGFVPVTTTTPYIWAPPDA
jgi:GNAT superfamily N-acetyltransferase